MTARYIWLGQVFNDEEISQSYAISAAASEWQKGLLQALSRQKVDLDIVGNFHSSLFPKGMLSPSEKSSNDVDALKQTQVGYLNLPFVRSISLSKNYKKKINRLIASGKIYDGLVTYNNYSWLESTARYVREKYNLPWISIVADDDAPIDADGYIFLSYGYYSSFDTPKMKLHLDGGVSEVDPRVQKSKTRGKNISAAYTGTLGPVGGVDLLFRSANLLNKNSIRVSVYGKASNKYRSYVEKRFGSIAANMLAGFVSKQELGEAMLASDVLLNPRPSSLPENQLNFPSKLLSYASYPIPTLSSSTGGISPEWFDFLFFLDEETPEDLVERIIKIADMSEDDHTEWNRKRLAFISSHTWEAQAERLSSFLAEFKNVGL